MKVVHVFLEFVVYFTRGFSILTLSRSMVLFSGKFPGGLEVAFVSECPGVDLKYYLIDQPGNCPAKNLVATMGLIRWAAQVVEALLSIYGMVDGSVHGDLRLENVSVGKYFI